MPIFKLVRNESPKDQDSAEIVLPKIYKAAV